jgi:hypothetical protein
MQVVIDKAPNQNAYASEIQDWADLMKTLTSFSSHCKPYSGVVQRPSAIQLQLM